jgi:hypothetical protein
MPRVRLRLKELLREEGLSSERLAQALEGRVGRATVYRWAAKSEGAVDLAPLAWVVWGLRQLTGKQYGVGDVLAYEEGEGEE